MRYADARVAGLDHSWSWFGRTEITLRLTDCLPALRACYAIEWHVPARSHNCTTHKTVRAGRAEATATHPALNVVRITCDTDG
jgi:hypothetical protein